VKRRKEKKKEKRKGRESLNAQSPIALAHTRDEVKERRKKRREKKERKGGEVNAARLGGHNLNQEGSVPNQKKKKKKKKRATEGHSID